MLQVAPLITELQSLGLRLPRAGLRRQGGAGPAEGGTLLAAGRAFNVPTASPFVTDSPFSLDDSGGELWVRRGGTRLLQVDLPPRPRFYHERDQQGTPLRQLALLHGADCLATTVLQTCVYWPEPTRCRFCGIELSLRGGQTTDRKTPEQLARAALRAHELDGVRHVVLTTGATREGREELRLLADCARAIKRSAGLPVHAQFCPPREPGAMAALQDSGIDAVGIHIESMDPAALKWVAPAKAAMGLKRFQAAWQEAVEVFGPGQVESFLIAGLGESPESLITGADMLAELGVYPFVVPLRPIPGSLLQADRPPSPEVMDRIYRGVARVLQRRGLHSSQCAAGCVRCGACGALWAYELEPAEMVCHRARTSGELARALAIRHQVFVREQGIVKRTDQDQEDRRSIHLVAEHQGEIVGTVRVFQTREGRNQWVGGRLAVAREHRSSGAGQLLVRYAMLTVKREGCTRFLATVQQKNVPFFQYIGWRKEGEPFDLHDWPHQLMVADLDRVE